MNNNFAVFIITHNRPNQQYTYELLRKNNYTGKIYFVLDDSDESVDVYKKLYGEDNIIIFHKANNFYLADNLTGLDKVPVYARNESFKIAKDLGLSYFLQLDDDYIKIDYRYQCNNELKRAAVKNFDTLFSCMCEFLKLPYIYCLAFGVDGDFIGGKDSKYKEHLVQNARNSFFCKVDFPFDFLGRINEDVTTPLYYNTIGKLFLTILDVDITLLNHADNSGGSTEQYKYTNTYWNYFYPILFLPNCVTIKNTKNGEYIKSISWNNALPKIISGRFKKYEK